MTSGPTPDWIAEVARLQVVAVDGLDIELDAESLLGLRRDLLLQERAQEEPVVPAQPVHGRGLGVSGRPRGCEDRGIPPVFAAIAPAPES